MPHGHREHHVEALPHGVGRRVRSLVATVLFKLPVVREICLWTGCVDARRSVAEKLLDRRHSLLVVPGGEAEQIRTAYGRERVYLKRRKGFVKLAMRKGVPVVPVYVFGCSDAYRTSHALFGPRNWLVKNLGVCVTFATGKWGSPCCPFPVRHTVVFGRPVDVAEGAGEEEALVWLACQPTERVPVLRSNVPEGAALQVRLGPGPSLPAATAGARARHHIARATLSE